MAARILSKHLFTFQSHLGGTKILCFPVYDFVLCGRMHADVPIPHLGSLTKCHTFRVHSESYEGLCC